MANTISSVTTKTGQTERLLGFSDALFAIAITFLALDIAQVPGDGNFEIGEFLREHRNEYLVYFACFLIVGFLWWRHHLLFRYIKARSAGIVWLNMALLALVAALPYPAAVLSQSFGLGLAMLILLVPLAVIGYLLWFMWELALHQNLTIPQLPDATLRYMRATLLCTPMVLTVGSVLAYLSYLNDSETLCYWAAGSTVLVFILPPLCWRRWPAPEQAVEVAAGDASELSAAESEDASLALARRTLTKIRNGSDTDRVRLFTDAVVSIAVTILALQLRPPPAAEGAEMTNQLLLDNMASLPWRPYLMTFIFVGVFWVSHVQIFERVVGVDSVLIWLNVVFLMFIAFLPLPTDLLNVSAGPEVAIIYLGCMLLISLTLALMSAYASFGRHIARARKTPDGDKIALLNSAWLVAAFLIAITGIAVTGDPAWSNAVLVLIILRGLVLHRVLKVRVED